MTTDQPQQAHHVNPEEEHKEALESTTENTTENSNQREEKKWRAKLYQLNMDGGWDDLGTGYAHVDTQK